MKKIIYLQFTDPGGYPPLIHSSRILANEGWSVLFLGSYSFGGKDFNLADHQNIEVRRLKYVDSKFLKKIQYGKYLIWSLYWVFKFKPAWIYASDHLASPVAFLVNLLFKVKTVYHEHDSVLDHSGKSGWIRFCLRSRNKLAQKADIVILPNSKRIELFKKTIPRTDPVCVWNCASKQEVVRKSDPAGGKLKLIYCGSINRQRLPISMLDVMFRLDHQVCLEVIGYETVGSVGYLEEFENYARKLDLSDEWRYLGSLRKRESVLKAIRGCDLGLSFMPDNSDDINMRYMAGASNKPFDYLSQGTAVLVSNLPEWKKMYADTGYGFACDSGSVQDLVDVLTYCINNKKQIFEMGKRGQEKVCDKWNYECQFSPVLKKMNPDI